MGFIHIVEKLGPISFVMIPASIYQMSLLIAFSAFKAVRVSPPEFVERDIKTLMVVGMLCGVLGTAINGIVFLRHYNTPEMTELLASCFWPTAYGISLVVFPVIVMGLIWRQDIV